MTYFRSEYESTVDAMNANRSILTRAAGPDSTCHEGYAGLRCSTCADGYFLSGLGKCSGAFAPPYIQNSSILCCISPVIFIIQS